eukprot:scaffold95509_cov48-Phaeocystis_antarctica.AAC.1
MAILTMAVCVLTMVILAVAVCVLTMVVLAVAVCVLTMATLSQLANAEGDVLENLELIENLE